MGLTDKLKDWFMDPPKVEEVAEKHSETPLSSNALPMEFSMGNGAAVASTTDYVTKIAEKLKVARGVVVGPDYFTFAEAIKKKEGKVLIDQQKYEYTFDALEAAGLNYSTLVDSAEGTLRNLVNLESEVTSQLEEAMVKLVEEPLKKAQEIKESIQEQMKEVQMLEKQAQEAQAKLAGESTAFKQAIVNQATLINQHLSNIKLYLNGKSTSGS